MSNRLDDGSDVLSGLIEELNLRDDGVGNESERCSVIYSCSEEEDDDGGSDDYGGDDDDSHVRHSEDDMYFSDTVEVGSYRNGYGFEEDPYETGSYEGQRGSEDFGGDDDYEEDDDSGGEYDGTDSSEDYFDDVGTRSLFSCPLCSMDIEVRALRIHFQQEHRVDVRNEVCPLCGGYMGRDVTRHFMKHHGTSVRVEFQKNLQSVSFNFDFRSVSDPRNAWRKPKTNVVVTLQRRRKPLRPGNIGGSTVLGNELSSFLGYAGSSRTLPELPSDVSDSQDTRRVKFSDEKALNLSNAKSSEPIQDDAQKEEIEKQRKRAAFVQELVASTLL